MQEKYLPTNSTDLIEKTLTMSECPKICFKKIDQKFNIFNRSQIFLNEPSQKSSSSKTKSSLVSNRGNSKTKLPSQSQVKL